jgi:UDP-N-acetylmuramyl pentapeptide phosphotransferase/UDP-N-acetylglucosamine-1-phosphate transferase
MKNKETFLFESIFPSLIGFVTALAFYGLLRLLALKDIKLLRKFFYVPARKSLTNAVQLGGLPYALGVYSGLYLTGFYNQPMFEVISLYWLMASSQIVLYGYLDDKFELRPVVKLGFQFFSVTLFSLLTSFSLVQSYQALFFICSFLWSFGSLNGSNLLDGLDTLTIKLATANFLLVAGIFYFTGVPDAMWISGIFISGLVAFYFFNREPSTIHMGEIGGSFLGSSYVFCSVLIFALTEGTLGVWDRVAFSLMPLNLPMVESGMSFLRRIYNKKSPFSGDKLHIHHILKIHKGFSATISSTLFAAGYIGTVLLSLPLFYLSPIVGYISHIFIMIGTYIMVGGKYWQGEDTLIISPKELFNTLRKKDVMIIESSLIDDFSFTLINEDDEDYHEENEDEKEEEYTDSLQDQDDKKAA